MGVIHKLKPEVLNFILENKQNNPGMSCRHLTSLIFEQLHIKVSKSSVNAVFKENSLSMPAGRRAKEKKKKFKMPVLPVIEEKNRLGSLPQEISEKVDQAGTENKEDQLKEKQAQDALAAQQEQERLKQEKAAQEAARLKAKEEARIKESARLAKEAQARQEEERRAAEEKAAQEAKIKALEEQARAAEEKRKLEEARVRELEEARKRELEKAAKEEEEKKRIEEIARKVAEEKAAQELARIKAAEEARMQELERAAQELARMKAQEEERLKELERLAQEAAESKRRQEEAFRLEQERIAQEEARIKALEDARLRELEKAVRDAEEKRKQQEEARRAAEEKAAQEAARIKELERLAQEAEAKRKLEEGRKLEEQKNQEIARIKELERLAKELQAKQEEERRFAEEKAREAELKAEKEKWARLAEQEQKAKQAPESPVKPAPESPAKPVSEPPQPESQVPQVLPEERVCSGAMVLKTLDSLIGVSKSIGELVNRATGMDPDQATLMTQALIFRSLFVKDAYSALGDLIGVRYSQEKLNAYYSQIKQIGEIGQDTVKIISNAFTEVKGIKMHFTDGNTIHLDGQFYSSWPAARFPYDFSNPVAELRKHLDKNFLSGSPLVLFSPPGYDIFPKDFFSLLLNFTSKEIRPDSLTLFGNQLEDLETVPVEQRAAYSLIFGLWPWQFTSSRRVRKIGDFYLKYIKEIDRDLYLGEIEIDLFRASVNQSISLKGCAVKTDLKEKIRLVILNSAPQAIGMDQLAGMFLGRWPNFEEAFQDFSRKIELFTYAGGEQPFFPKDSFSLDNAGIAMDLAGILQNYLKMLDAYLRWHFLPNEYREKDLSTTTECFYKVPAKLIGSEARLRVKTLVSQDYQYLRDLEYLNCRLNERQISAPNGKRIWFESAFK